MGSGETAPTMAKVHRELISRMGPSPVPAAMLDTPFGFQENADDITAKAVDYFRESVQRAHGRGVLPVRRRGRRRPCRLRADAGPAAGGRLRVRRARQPLLRPGAMGRQPGAGGAGREAAHRRRHHLRQRRRLHPGHVRPAGVRGLQGGPPAALAGRPRPGGRGGPAGGDRAALQQRRGRQPRHPVLLHGRAAPVRPRGPAARRRLHPGGGRAHRLHPRPGRGDGHRRRDRGGHRPAVGGDVDAGGGGHRADRRDRVDAGRGAASRRPRRAPGPDGRREIGGSEPPIRCSKASPGASGTSTPPSPPATAGPR